MSYESNIPTETEPKTAPTTPEVIESTEAVAEAPPQQESEEQEAATDGAPPEPDVQPSGFDETEPKAASEVPQVVQPEQDRYGVGSTNRS